MAKALRRLLVQMLLSVLSINATTNHQITYAEEGGYLGVLHCVRGSTC